MNIEEIKDFVYEVRTFGITSNDTKFVQITEYLLSELEKEKEKNKELTERVLKLESDKFWDNVVSKNKIKQIIYPTPENEIPIEIQQSEMYKKIVKEVEE